MEEKFISFIDLATTVQIEKLIAKLELEEDRDFEDLIIYLTSLII